EKKEDLKTTYLNRYNTLSNDYNDAFYSSMYSKFSEAEKSQMLQDIALTWDTLLNDVWKYLEKNMEPSKFETLKKDQIKWVEKKMKVEKEENIWGMSGNAFAQSKWSTLGQMNKERVKFLIDNYL
ncbi:MAG: lysozyme inhibitor LprI family protein, partial [Clostridium sp.]|uniref:lysozyme inhibitor LprI family protein n=1 Tax=Clostridium sp. TaxID=1506 RepID=UPI003F32E62E